MSLAGYPAGTMIEIYGSEGVGKTSLAMQAMASVTSGHVRRLHKHVVHEEGKPPRLAIDVVSEKSEPGFCLLIDTEFKWDASRAVRFGVNPDHVYQLNPETVSIGKGKKAVTTQSEFITLEAAVKYAEQAFSMIRSEERLREVPALIVWDSLAATPSEEEAAGAGIYASGIASKARMVRGAMRKLAAQLSSYNVLFIIINQIYDRIGAPGTDTSGGRGLKFHSSMRLSIGRPQSYTYGPATGTPVGVFAKVTPKKSAFCAPNFQLEIPIRFYEGIDDVASMVLALAEAKSPLITAAKAGGYLTINHGDTPVKVQGAYNLREALTNRPEVVQALRQEVVRVLGAH